MENKPTAEEILDRFHATSRVPLDEVKRHPHGRTFTQEARTIVRPAEAGWQQRLDLGNSHMLDELAGILSDPPSGGENPSYPFLLVSRRANRTMNSAGRLNPKLVSESHNPVYLHPTDIAELGLENRRIVVVRSRHGSVKGLVEADERLRRGIVSMTHGFGGNPGEDENPEALGCNVGRLMSSEAEFDPVTGIPRMSALPVCIEVDDTLVLGAKP